MKKQSLRSGLLATTTLLSSFAIPALIAGVVSLAPTGAEAQDYTSGAVAVTVKDAKGAPVAGATVILTSQAQGITKTLKTGANGSASTTGLAPGDYNITVSAAGFDTYNGTASVIVSQEVKYTYALNTTGATSEVVVKGKRVRQDFTKVTTGLSVDVTTLTSQQAIGRSVEAVTLLAPTVVNSTAFGEPSIGGGSAAENAYYINGLNVTNPDTYVGLATVPFDFYKTVEVQTSGSPAEFGRATGGVVNSTTKYGTNNFMFGVHGNFAPNSLRSKPFAAFNTTNPVKFRSSDNNSVSFEAGGPIIKDKLFLYGLVQLQDTKSQFSSWSAGYLEKDENKDPFYGLKGDWYITPTNHLELTYFDTTQTTKQTRYAYTCANMSGFDLAGATPSTFKTCASDGSDAVIDYTKGYGATTKTGGPSWVLKYTGNLTDWATLSVAYGDTKYDNDFQSASPNEYYSQAYHKGYFIRTSKNQIYSAGNSKDDWERKFMRADVDLRFNALGKHHVRFGFDNEDLSMTKTLTLPGALPLRYYLLPDYGYGYVIYEKLGGHVSSKDTAYYIQDSWDLTSTLNLQLGLRNDDFKAKNLSGQQFVSLTGNIAPRVGISFKPSEDSNWRFTAYYGQEYIPPAMNLGFRGKDLYFAEYFYSPASGFHLDPATGLPTAYGNKMTGRNTCPTYPAAGVPGGLDGGGDTNCATYGNGTQEPADKKMVKGLKASRSTEFNLGAQYKLNDLWSFDLTYVNRKLDRVSEDTDFAPFINDYCTSKAMTCNFSNEYHVWNVGSEVTINTFETLPNGEKTITLKNLPFDKPKRDYWGATLGFKRAFDGKWGLQGSYTYSRSTGNYEGTVLSTGSGSGQTDAGSTLLYDYPGLAKYATGVLPNNRDHEFKVWGSWAATPDLLIGANVSVISPYYFSCYAKYPEGGSGDAAYGYGAVSHYCIDKSQQTGTASGIVNGVPKGTPYYAVVPSPMGKGGKSDWTKTIDLSLRYTVPHAMPAGGKLVLRADIFNLFNDKEVLAATQNSGSSYQFKPGTPVDPNDPTYLSNLTKWQNRCGTSHDYCATANTLFGTPTVYAQQRFVRIGFDLTY